MDGDLLGQLRRFLLVGATNTALSFGLLLALGTVLELWLAYTIAFAAGVAYSAVLSRRYVFRSDAGSQALLRFALGYAMVYLAGRALLAVADSAVTGPDWIVSALLIAVTAPLSFAVGRWTLAASTTDPSARDEEHRTL